jgi:hypothetical protein
MSAYAVEKVCRSVVMDAGFREQLREEPSRALEAARPALTESERRALIDGDVGTLSRGGASGFLLWQLSRFSLFGLDDALYAQRIRAAYADERARMRAAGELP